MKHAFTVAGELRFTTEVPSGVVTETHHRAIFEISVESEAPRDLVRYKLNDDKRITSGKLVNGARIHWHGASGFTSTRRGQTVRFEPAENFEHNAELDGPLSEDTLLHWAENANRGGVIDTVEFTIDKVYD